MRSLIRTRVAVDTAVSDVNKYLPIVFFIALVVCVVSSFGQNLGLDVATGQVQSVGQQVYRLVRTIGNIGGIVVIAWMFGDGIATQQLNQKWLQMAIIVIGLIILNMLPTLITAIIGGNFSTDIGNIGQ